MIYFFYHSLLHCMCAIGVSIQFWQQFLNLYYEKGFSERFDIHRKKMIRRKIGRKTSFKTNNFFLTILLVFLVNSAHICTLFSASRIKKGSLSFLNNSPNFILFYLGYTFSSNRSRKKTKLMFKDWNFTYYFIRFKFKLFSNQHLFLCESVTNFPVLLVLLLLLSFRLLR